ncbi:MAG: serine/threonine protein kinase, partial [Verrucomicrobiales bacterium]|nr:serine/threonine protein kinase [Verrucomicrobiales bacterium]
MADDEEDTLFEAPSLPSRDLDLHEIREELPHFRFERILSHTAMSTVWSAWEEVLERKVAIKLLRNVNRDPAFVQRFIREARTLAKLKHQSVVVIHSFGRIRSNHCYLVMEMIEGQNLAELMRPKLMELPQVLTIITQVCDALTYAHGEGYVHRDVKPANVLIDKRGIVKVVDFGLTRLTRDRDPGTLSITRAGYAMGTPEYMAPEQAQGHGNEDHRADIFSV